MKNIGNKKLARKLNYADCIRKYKINASLEEIRDAAARICRDYLTGQWKFITTDSIVVKRISGGLSNFLYYVSLPEDGSTLPISSLVSAGQSICCESNSEDSSIKQTVEMEVGDGNGRTRERSNSGEKIVTSLGGYVQNTQGEEPREVLLRIYGQTHGENALEAMITESVVFALLSERNFGPKLHGIFPGGRIEQYIPARPLATAQLSEYNISMKIAEKMGEIHSLNIPMSKEPDWVWNCMDRWLKSIGGILTDTPKKDLEAEIEEVISFNFWEEAKWLKSVIDSENYPVLFCHNDLQEGNILFRENEVMSSSDPNTKDTCRADFKSTDIELNANSISSPPVNGCRRTSSGLSNNNGNSCSVDLENPRDVILSNNSDCDPDLIIIDFEYCAYNYRGFDLANHFLEWTLDYNNLNFPFYFHRKCQYPTQQQRYDFIASYLKKLNESIESYVPSLVELQAVDKEVSIFSMFSHLFWSMWSVVNVNSSIEFGYWNYAVTRIREYKQLKQSYLSIT